MGRSFLLRTLLSRSVLLFLLLFFAGGSLIAQEEEEEEENLFGEENPTIFLTIETALQRALTENRQLLNTVDSALGAAYQVNVAYSEFDLKIDPKGDLGYVGGGWAGDGLGAGIGLAIYKKFACGTRISVTPTINKTNRVYNSNVRTIITQPLLRGWGREYTLSAVRAAEFSQRTANRNLFLAQTRLVLRTISTLYDVIKAQKNVEIADESHRRLQAFYQAAKFKVQLGLSDALDIYRAETEMRNTEDALRSAQDRLLEVEDMLRDILAIPIETPLSVEVPLDYHFEIVPVDEALVVALQNRVELQQAEDQVRDNQRVARVARENMWPELNLTFNYNNCGQDQIFTESCCWYNRESTWGVGFTSSGNYNPTADRLNYEQRLLSVDAATRTVDQTASNIEVEVKKAIRHLERMQQRIEIQTKQMKTTVSELRLAEIKFNRGLANNFDVIQAEKALRSAELQYWNSLIDHIIGEYQLRHAVGLLIDPPEFGCGGGQ